MDVVDPERHGQLPFVGRPCGRRCARGSWQEASVSRTVCGELEGLSTPPPPRVPHISGLGLVSHVRIGLMVAVPSGLRGLRSLRLVLAGVALALLSIASGSRAGPVLAPDRAAPRPGRPRPPARRGPGAVEGFMVVDCLLPGQIRQLGGKVTYVDDPPGGEDRGARLRDPRWRVRVARSGQLRDGVGRCGCRWPSRAIPRAQTYVGGDLRAGTRHSIDPAAAATWYRKARRQGAIRARR